jgi:hypothetical protein
MEGTEDKAPGMEVGNKLEAVGKVLDVEVEDRAPGMEVEGRALDKEV